MSLMAGLLWVVAAMIVGSMIYMSALERTRDFAVFKAVGVPTRSILAGLAIAGHHRGGAVGVARRCALGAVGTTVPDAGGYSAHRISYCFRSSRLPSEYWLASPDCAEPSSSIRQ